MHLPSAVPWISEDRLSQTQRTGEEAELSDGHEGGVDAMRKARKSVRVVMVMPMPALEKVMPTLCGTSTSRSMLSPQEDISRNMSSTPMPAPPGKRVGEIKSCGSERSRVA